VVGLVEDRDRDLAEVEATLLDEVLTRPGVPMTMSTPRWSAPTWRAWGTPP
jgi:hypothetical protein